MDPLFRVMATGLVLMNVQMGVVYELAPVLGERESYVTVSGAPHYAMDHGFPRGEEGPVARCARHVIETEFVYENSPQNTVYPEVVLTIEPRLPAELAGLRTPLYIAVIADIGTSTERVEVKRLMWNPADFNLDGATNVLDFCAFINAFAEQRGWADFNNDGDENVLDFGDYLNAWERP